MREYRREGATKVVFKSDGDGSLSLFPKILPFRSFLLFARGISRWLRVWRWYGVECSLEATRFLPQDDKGPLVLGLEHDPPASLALLVVTQFQARIPGFQLRGRSVLESIKRV